LEGVSHDAVSDYLAREKTQPDRYGNWQKIFFQDIAAARQMNAQQNYQLRVFAFSLSSYLSSLRK